MFKPQKIQIFKRALRTKKKATLLLVVSSPGTNWMVEILGLIRHDGDPAWVRNEYVLDRSPWIETADGLNIALKYPPPRLLCSHLQFQLFPKSFLRSKAKVREGATCTKAASPTDEQQADETTLCEQALAPTKAHAEAPWQLRAFAYSKGHDRPPSSNNGSFVSALPAPGGLTVCFSSRWSGMRRRPKGPSSHLRFAFSTRAPTFVIKGAILI